MNSWLSLDLGSIVNLFPIILKETPILVAKHVKITYTRMNSIKPISIILSWLNTNIFASACRSFVISDGQEIHFSLEVTNNAGRDQLYKFVTNESIFEETISAKEKFSPQIGGLEPQFEDISRIVK